MKADSIFLEGKTFVSNRLKGKCYPWVRYWAKVMPPWPSNLTPKMYMNSWAMLVQSGVNSFATNPSGTICTNVWRCKADQGHIYQFCHAVSRRRLLGSFCLVWLLYGRTPDWLPRQLPWWPLVISQFGPRWLSLWKIWDLNKVTLPDLTRFIIILDNNT